MQPARFGSPPAPHLVAERLRLDRDGMGRTWNGRWHAGSYFSQVEVLQPELVSVAASRWKECTVP